jgi:hypothetical protein
VSHKTQGENNMSYENGDYEGINAVLGSDGAYCVEHALIHVFNGDVEALDNVINGKDTSFHYDGKFFELITDNTIDFESIPQDYYPDGLYCIHEGCNAELVQPNEDIDEEQEKKPQYKPFEYVYAWWLPAMEKRIACKRVVCSDGKQRRANFIGEPDTAFTQPCYVSVKGKSVMGFCWYDSDTNTVRFTHYSDYKNGKLLPEWTYKK